MRFHQELDAYVMERVLSAVMQPLALLGVLLGSAFVTWQKVPVSHLALLAVLVPLVGGVVVAALQKARDTGRAVLSAADSARTAELEGLARVVAAAEKTVLWSADELCRGERPPMPAPRMAEATGLAGQVESAVVELQMQAVASLRRVHDESQTSVQLDVLRCVAVRQHALISKALTALTDLQGQTDDPELLAAIFRIDHLVVRARRHVEGTALLGGHSLRRTRQPVTVTTALRGAVSEVVQYPRVTVTAGDVGIRWSCPGHVGPDLTHLLAELIENALEYSDPATKVEVRAQQVPTGLAVEIEDRGMSMHPRIRHRVDQLLAAPDQVDVSDQVRAGQIGLLITARIAQQLGIKVALHDNLMGGTTAVVIVPEQLLVTTQPAGEEIPEHIPPPAVVPSSVRQHGAPAASPAPLPDLPRRVSGQPPAPARQPSPHAPVTASVPGRAAAFRDGVRGGPPVPPPHEHPN
ncbi:sensor histidine kinase [Streptomyces sp. NPDC056160]|uniref:sensor histidine kinase n=1 Tax=Streptomyces sp. NPDC056160 TaxID=3345731 RepID=UPI0035E143D8